MRSRKCSSNTAVRRNRTGGTHAHFRLSPSRQRQTGGRPPRQKGDESARRRTNDPARAETAPRERGQSRGSRERQRPRRHRAQGKKPRHRLDGAPRAGRGLVRCKKGDPGIGRARGNDRRPACAQSGHDRRLARQQRSIGRLSRRGASARRHRRNQQAEDPRRQILQGPVRDRTRTRRVHHAGDVPAAEARRLPEIPESRFPLRYGRRLRRGSRQGCARRSHRRGRGRGVPRKGHGSGAEEEVCRIVPRRHQAACEGHHVRYSCGCSLSRASRGRHGETRRGRRRGGWGGRPRLRSCS
jgi:hypothetical protein